MSLETAVSALRTTIGGVPQIKACFDQPPPEITNFPAALAYIGEGEMSTLSHGDVRGLHMIILEVHIARLVTPEAVISATIWPELIFNALLADQTLGGTVAHIVFPLRYRAVPIAYGSEIHYSVRFEVTVKIR